MSGLSSLRSVRLLAAELAPSGITEASLRWAIFNRHRNGLDASGALIRPPGTRRVFIDRERFETWLRSRSTVDEPHPTAGPPTERASRRYRR
jgi:hypothetical protein